MTTEAVRTRLADALHPACEWRLYLLAIGQPGTPRRMSRFACPWCRRELKIVPKLLAERGQPCTCGAIFGGKGVAYKLMAGK